MAHHVLAANRGHDTHHVTTHSWLDGLGLLAVTALGLVAGFVSRNNGYDDAFITYRYAYNLATGQGFVYNAGEWYLGTTTPLYGLLLGLLGLPNPEAIPAISGYVSGLSLLLAGLALYRYAWLHGRRLAGWLAGAFYVTSPLLVWTFGGEMLFLMALMTWAFVAYRLQRTVVAAVLLALAVLTRVDAMLAVPVIGLHYVVTWRRLPWREAGVMALILLPWALLAWWLYGSPLPGTLGAKLAQGDSGLWALFRDDSIEWFRALLAPGGSATFRTVPAAPHGWVILAAGAAGIPALVRYRFWLLPLAWVVLYGSIYLALGVPFYHWYTVPLALGILILASAGIAGVVDGVLALARRLGSRRLPGPALSWHLIGGACLVLLAPLFYAQLEFAQRYAKVRPTADAAAYELAGHWLRDHTPAGASVGYVEIGILGYYAQRTIIDPLGLVNRGVSPRVAQRDFTWAYARYRPDYIVLSSAPGFQFFNRSLSQQSWFRREYREVAQIEQPGYPTLAVHRRAVPKSVTTAQLRKLFGNTDLGVDEVNDVRIEPDRRPIAVSRGQPLLIRGWAVDSGAERTAGAVIIAIDGITEVQAEYGLGRSDVERKLGSEVYRYSGFRASIPTDELTPGRHVVTLRVVTWEGDAYYEAPRPIEIDVR